MVKSIALLMGTVRMGVVDRGWIECVDLGWKTRTLSKLRVRHPGAIWGDLTAG
jgi:hypothetical protein